MEIVNPCCCCLLRPANKDLNTPYIYFGVTEKFSDLLEECFQIQFNMGLDNECGICEVCVGRLRDASDFKLQVQRSQAELQARLERALCVKENDLVKLEKSQEVDDMIEEDLETYAAPSVKSETSDDAFYEEEFISCDGSAWAPSQPGLVSARAREQLAMACSVRLERLHTQPRTSPHRSSLTTHMRVRAEQHTERTEERDLVSAVGAGAETYTCDTCGKRFARRSDTVTHLKKPCSKTLGVQYNSENDNRTEVKDNSYSVFSKKREGTLSILPHKPVDNGDKLFVCDICNKILRTKKILRVHIRIHTGHKPYTCDICNKQFSTKGHLTRHIRIHTGYKPHTCDICNKKFTTKDGLTEHIRIHTGHKPFTCDICNKQFTTNGYLTKHTRIHTGHKPYSCDICNKQFTRKGSLTRHIRIHTGHKPYTCDICNKQFIRKYYLNRHIRIHTGHKLYT